MVIIAYDLGTGGVKAALYDDSLKVLAKSFMEYRTYFPGAGLHEQKPSDWWNGGGGEHETAAGCVAHRPASCGRGGYFRPEPDGDSRGRQRSRAFGTGSHLVRWEGKG